MPDSQNLPTPPSALPRPTITYAVAFSTGRFCVMQGSLQAGFCPRITGMPFGERNCLPADSADSADSADNKFSAGLLGGLVNPLFVVGAASCASWPSFAAAP
jgi:hypothetical protein